MRPEGEALGRLILAVPMIVCDGLEGGQNRLGVLLLVRDCFSSEGRGHCAGSFLSSSFFSSSFLSAEISWVNYLPRWFPAFLFPLLQ